MELGVDKMNRCVEDVQTSWLVAKLVLREKALEWRENQIQSTRFGTDHTRGHIPNR